ncbi:MAG: TetR/AcrR family transcriptional regulator [Coriobacteriia bacterium]|nr:TetR/AcrR family transcriptional regulator [Coriobacteriia bacterium]MBS5478533.1 TetR/AcrR family transcriptional regulator [Coriobacteriia bacterium]
MYHISKDKRARRSAWLIWEGLERCLETTELKNIRITDINEASYVSRATFYRLFDSVEDVLVYRCDQIFDEVGEGLARRRFASNREVFLFFARTWTEQKTLLKALVDNNLIGIIYDAHQRRGDLVRWLYVGGEDLSERDYDYLVAILTSIMPAVMSAWCARGQSDNPEEIYEAVAHAVGLVAEGLKGEAAGRA